MKSYAHQSIPRKRIKKLAAKFTDDEIRASLGENEDNRAYIDEQAQSVGYWNAFNGPMVVMNDDAVLVYAQVEFLRRHGYPSFSSLDEVHAYAKANGWPRKRLDELGKKESS